MVLDAISESHKLKKIFILLSLVIKVETNWYLKCPQLELGNCSIKLITFIYRYTAEFTPLFNSTFLPFYSSRDVHEDSRLSVQAAEKVQYTLQTLGGIGPWLTEAGKVSDKVWLPHPCNTKFACTEICIMTCVEWLNVWITTTLKIFHTSGFYNWMFIIGCWLL